MTSIKVVGLPNEENNQLGTFISSDMPRTIFFFNVLDNEINIVRDIAFIEGVNVPLVLSPHKLNQYKDLLRLEIHIDFST